MVALRVPSKLAITEPLGGSTPNARPNPVAYKIKINNNYVASVVRLSMTVVLIFLFNTATND